MASSPYFGGASSAPGGGYFGGGAAPASAKSGGGTFGFLKAIPGVSAVENALGGVGHVIAKTGEGLALDAYHLPGGLYQMGKAGVHAAEGHPGDLVALLKGMGQSVVTSAEHPLRVPDQTLLNLLAVASLGAGAVARVGAAADAAEAGGGLGAAAKALASKPESAPRLLTVGDKQIPLQPSARPLPRAIQGVGDKIAQKAIDTNPEGRIASRATRRLGTSSKETRTYQGAMQASPASRLQADSMGLPGRSVAGRLSPARQVQQAALRLTTEQMTPEEKISFHQKQFDAGVNPKAQARQIALMQKVQDLGLTKQDEHGAVVIDAAAHPKLAAVDAKLAAGQAARDKILADTGQMTATGLQSRIDAPGRIVAGAKYVEPTPSRAGVSPALDAATAGRDRLAILHEKALNQEASWHAAQKVKDLGPLTEVDAKARLAQLNDLHDTMAAKIIPEVSPYGGTLSKREQLVRNFDNSKARAVRKPTVKAEELQAASDKLHEIAAKGGSPAADALAKLLDERARLHDALLARGEASLTGAEAPALPRGAAPAHVSVPPASNPYRNRIVQLGIRREAAQAKVDRLMAAAERRREPTGIVGGETARPGRGYSPYFATEPKAAASSIGRASTSVVGKVKNLIPATKTFKGGALEQGNVPVDTTGLAARQMQRAYRYLNTDTFRRDIVKAGSDTRQTSRDVLVNTQALKNAKVPDSVRAELGDQRSTLHPDEVAGHAQAFDAWRQQIIPGLKDKFAGEKKTPIGMGAPAGFKWVDKNLLSDLADPGIPSGGRVGTTADTVNSAVTAATVYFKVGHVATRALTNAATNIIQGSADPISIGKSVRLWKALPTARRDQALAAVGRGGIAAMPHEGVNIVGTVASHGAAWWSKHFDQPFRFNSIAYEARKAGFDTPAKFAKMLDQLQNPAGLDAQTAARLDGVAKRANRESIAYDRLSTFEKRYIMRAVWFYPWVKGATEFAGNTLMEHPFKSAAIGAVGAQGTKGQVSELGQLPSYERGLFKVAGSASSPLVADLSTISPFATPAQVAETLIHANRPTQAEQFANYLNPVYGTALGATANLNEYGQPSNKGVIKNAVASLVAPMPETTLLHALMSGGGNQANRMFPASTKYSALRFLLGSGTPRPMNRPVANARAKTEATAAGR